MIAAILVTVLVDGTPVTGSTPARLRDDVVVAPLMPYVSTFAESVVVDAGRGTIALTCGDRTVLVTIGSMELSSGSMRESLPIAPYLRAGEAVIPLAAVARALGAGVDFDAASKTLSIVRSPDPLASLLPDVSYTAPPEPAATFTPNPTAPPAKASPKPVPAGVPKPRRTPILVDHGDL